MGVSWNKIFIGIFLSILHGFCVFSGLFDRIITMNEEGVKVIYDYGEW